MEISRPARHALRRTAIAFAALLIGTTHFASAQGEALARQETGLRGARAVEARDFLTKGDEAYMAGRFAEAIEAYGAARDRLPAAPATFDLRQAATERYAQAAVEQARQLSRTGDVQTAKEVLDRVLAADVAPSNEGALLMRTQLDDPIRTNPALTAEHARRVDEVRRLLYIAQGAFDLGKFDESKRRFEEVLRLDPHNSAARRGMEKAAAARSEYYKTAQDHTRAEFLKEVDAAWENPLPPVIGTSSLTARGPLLPDTPTISSKLDRIIIPKIAFDSATIFEAVNFLRSKAAELDTTEPDPAQRGFNITINLGAPDSPAAKAAAEQPINLQLTNVPVSHVLKYITEITRTSYTVDDFAVIINPAGFTSDEMITRTYRVPPDFLTAINQGSPAATAASDDPFDTTAERQGLLTQRLGAKEALEKQGVKFPQGASAYYNAASNSLRVTNTATNLDFITRLLDVMTESEPVMVKVSVTMIQTEKTNLDELGFDWLVNPFGASASHVFASGGTLGNGSARTGADMISPIAGTAIDSIPSDPSAAVQSNLVTNGLRSGDYAISDSNSIDSLINNQDRSSQTSSVAPGIMGATGLFTDGQVQTLMRGLAQKKNVDIVARPSVTTRSGQASSIHLVREFIYPTEYEPPEIPNSVSTTSFGGGLGGLGGIGGGGGGGGTLVTPATPTAFETREVGVVLEVLPVADANKRFVDVTLNPSFTAFDGFVNYGSPINTPTTNLLGMPETTVLTQNRILMPVFSAKRTSSQLTIADGATIVIGSLLRDSVELVNDKVPILGDAPLIGRLFQSKAQRRFSSALIFLVHVELCDPSGRPYRQ
ncbi:MAG: Amuc_1098 family type IV pilus outer membrane protein [Verrucomicrobiota bacterium]